MKAHLSSSSPLDQVTREKGVGMILAENMIVIVGLLLAVGLVMIMDATLARSESLSLPNSYLAKQMLFDFLGVIAFLVIVFSPPRLLKEYAPHLALLGVVLLVAVLFVGTEINGARRWFRLGPISFQPSEFAKIAFVIYFAYWLDKNRPYIAHFRKGLIPAFVLILSAAGLIAVEPDFGNAMLLGSTLSWMLIVAGARIRDIFLSLLAVTPVAVWVLSSKFSHIMDRITTYLDPSGDITGKGYQSMQALIALGSGGFTGKGIGKGLQKLFYLPEPHNDFIFAIIGEDVGFVGCAAVVILYLMLIWYAIQICRRSVDFFKMMVAFGLTFLFAGQVCINLMVVTKIIPNKGIPLPLISYGGSNAFFTLVSLGILVRLAFSLPPDRPSELGAIPTRRRRERLF